MPSENYDFDPSNSDLQIGLEIEYPAADSYDDLMIGRGNNSNYILDDIDHWPLSGRAEYDGTVGLEIVSDVLDLEDISGWYRDCIETVEAEHDPYQPTGLMSSGSTAGLHVHISSISEDKARELARLSEEPWMQVLFCSSIAGGQGDVTWPVFRGGRYCRLNYGNEHYDVVNGRGHGHYEWRLVEPMIPEHVEVLQKFLRLFEQNTEAAIEYAQELLDEGDDRITAIRRAEAVGMDIDSMPVIERSPAESDPEEFYEQVADDWALPEIYRVEHTGQEYYVMESEMSGVYDVPGMPEFPANGVLYADSLEEVNDPEIESNVQRAMNRRGNSNRETAATDELKKVLKKKKK